MSEVDEIRAMLERWAAAVRAHDLDGVIRDRSDGIVMFDVPEPLQAKGIDAYADTWRLYFRAEGSRLFELRELEVVAGEEVAWARAILRCTTDPEPAGRLTVGLRKFHGRWRVEHEHHSFPHRLTDLE